MCVWGWDGEGRREGGWGKTSGTPREMDKRGLRAYRPGCEKLPSSWKSLWLDSDNPFQPAVLQTWPARLCFCRADEFALLGEGGEAAALLTAPKG